MWEILCIPEKRKINELMQPQNGCDGLTSREPNRTLTAFVANCLSMDFKLKGLPACERNCTEHCAEEKSFIERLPSRENIFK